MSFFSFTSLFPLPLWKLLLDSIFGIVMWLMMTRFVLLIFVSEQTRMPVLHHIIAIGKRLVSWAAILTPRWLNIRTHDLYLVLLLFLARYYVLPTLADYDVRLVRDLPMEAKLASIASWLFTLF